MCFVALSASLSACHGAPSPGAPTLVAPAEAISLLGDTLKRPALDSVSRARMQAQLDQARLDASARPNDPDALIWVGRRLAYLGRYRDAIAVFSDGIQRFPKDARMYRHRGHRYVSVRQFDDAIADFDRAAGICRWRLDVFHGKFFEPFNRQLRDREMSERCQFFRTAKTYKTWK